MSEAMHKSKAEIRARMRGALELMTPEQRHAASAAACAKLTSLEPIENASVLMLYMPLAREVDVTPVALWCFRRAKTVCVPKVDWDRCEMDAVEVASLDDRVMDIDSHGVRVPRLCSPILPGMIDVVVVPGLAFDPQGRRLGRGGGYYDRFLARLKPSITRIGLVFDQQIIDQVPAMTHDISVDIVVSDRRVAHAQRSPTPPTT